MSLTDSVSRRKFLKSSALLLGAAAVPLVGSRGAAAAVATPQLEQGLQIGDVVADRAVIWSRSDRPARLVVDYDVNPSFSNAMRVRGPFALETTDYTARVDLTELPSDSDIHVRVVFQDLSNDRVISDPIFGHFRTVPTKNAGSAFCGAAIRLDRGGESNRNSAG